MVRDADGKWIPEAQAMKAGFRKEASKLIVNKPKSPGSPQKRLSHAVGSEDWDRSD